MASLGLNKDRFAKVVDEQSAGTINPNDCTEEAIVVREEILNPNESEQVLIASKKLIRQHTVSQELMLEKL